MNRVIQSIHWACFWLFVAVKVAGHTFAEWSWWWMLLAEVPTLSIFIKYFGL